MEQNTTLIAEAVPERIGPKNFRSHADFENFYRFVSDNDFRRETYIALKVMLQFVEVKKGRKSKKH